MLITLHYCRKDQQQAARLAAWLDELGPFPGHHFLIARDAKADPMVFIGHENLLIFNEIVIKDDTADKWPESANHAFKRIGKHIQHSLGAQAFLYLEPDCVITRTSAFDEVWAEYQKALLLGRRFLGQLIDQRKQGVDSPPHMSGVAVYAADLVQHAGIIYQADNVPFDIAAGPTIVPQMMQSELILHNWKSPPFESWADVERRIFAVRPKCAVFHSDKSGSLLGLLRERRTSNTFGAVVRRLTEIEKPLLSNVDELVEAAKEIVQEQGWRGGLPAENNLPVPVLSDDQARDMRAERAQIGTSRGGQFIPEPDSAAELPTDCNYQVHCTIENVREPWASKADSIAEIRQLATRLMQFSDSSPHVRLVRAELHDAGVIRLDYRYRKRRGWKRKKGKPSAPAL